MLTKIGRPLLNLFAVALFALAPAIVGGVGLVTQSGSRLFVEPTPPPTTGSITFVSNAASDFEYGRIQTVPTNWGAAEFTFSMWVRPAVGTASSYNFGDAAELTNWSAHDVQPYSAADWWYHGNFLLDGHNNASSAFYDGTFSLQIVGSGRVRWLFGDGAAANARTGDLHAVQAWPSSGAASIRDGNWHHIECVRRWDGGTGAILELWVDGVMVDSETSTARTNMYTAYWDDFVLQAAAQRGWFFGAEKQAAVGDFTQYADYKGDISEIAMFSRAKDTAELEDWQRYTPDGATGLLEVWRLTEPSGSMSGLNGTTLTINNGAGGQTISRSASDPF